MTAIAEALTVVTFAGQKRAAEVLARVQEVATDQPIEVFDAVAVYRTPEGQLRVHGSVLPTSTQSAGAGAAIGAFLGVLAATVATVGVGAGAAVGGAVGALLGAGSGYSEKKTVGVPTEFVREIAGLIPPGDSAVFLLGRTSNAELITEQFRGSGGTIVRTTLPPEVAAHVQTILQGGRSKT